MKTPHELVALATAARELAYAPYSSYFTGAALLCSDGSVYTGCNVENAAFSPSICAERVAISKAVSDGKRDFVSIAVVGGRVKEQPVGVSPCGVCLQVMREFCDPASFTIHLSDTSGAIYTKPLSAFLPLAFTASEFVKNDKEV